jgi:outer membrane protein assembly factor BamD (BamD/ComL family)
VTQKQIAVSSIVLLLVLLLFLVCAKQRSEKKKNADANKSQINLFGEIQSDSW